MLNLKSFQAAKCMLANIERGTYDPKGQLMIKRSNELSFVVQFYSLAGPIRPV